MRSIRQLLMLAVAAICISISANAQLPSVQLKDISGKPVDSATLSNDGKPFIISFWATWCKPCIRELSAIHDVYPDWVDETGVKVYAISIDEAQNCTKLSPSDRTRASAAGQISPRPLTHKDIRPLT